MKDKKFETKCYKVIYKALEDKGYYKQESEFQKHLKEVYLNFPKLKVMGILLENTGLKNLQQRLEN